MTIIEWENNYFLGEWQHDMFRATEGDLRLNPDNCREITNYDTVRLVLAHEIMEGNLKEVGDYILCNMGKVF